VRAAVLHALADVQHEIADQVRLVLVLLQVVLVGAAEDLPIQVPQIVTGRILSVFGELDREAVIGTAMQPRHISLDDVPGAQLQAFQFSQRPWV